MYCGLKQFSARMEAKNFTLPELGRLIELAHEKEVKVYVTVNSLLKPEDLDQAATILSGICRGIKADALIIQDLALVQMARKAGYAGEIHLSTLANVSFPAALKLIRDNLGVNRVVVPRELNIDEIKSMSDACPDGLSLEVFVHGALCYGISGRCYWSSYLGGKSGLRGQCVQPCRRQYAQDSISQKFFSCQDLSLDVLVKVLMDVPRISAWKIEGRKKSPHYVFYTTAAYRMLRDHGKDPAAKKSAVQLLERALGRPGTHYFFLPQRPYNPIDIGRHTGSGLFVGKVSLDRGKPALVPREELLAGDMLRVGYEGEGAHKILRVNKYVPKKGRLYLEFDGKKSEIREKAVFLTDRRETELENLISALKSRLETIQPVQIPDESVLAGLPRRFTGKVPVGNMTVYRTPPEKGIGENDGLWLSETGQPGIGGDAWWWLPPVIWPGEEAAWGRRILNLLRRGHRCFVLNAPWQIAFFREKKTLRLWAGPFCNIANPLAVDQLHFLGFSGVIVSPELSEEEYLRLPKNSPLPLGMVISGNWPLCLSRVAPPELKLEVPFVSPKKEQAWAAHDEQGLRVYPNWELDFSVHRDRLIHAGYRLFVTLTEPVPRTVDMKKRPGMWNWGISQY